MTEYNIFCYAENYNDKDSFQQARYRAFNKEVGEGRYKEIVKKVNNIFKDLKLELNKNSWKDEWKKVTPEQWKKLSQIPEFDKEIVENITGVKINTTPSLSGKTVEVKLDGVTYKAKII